MLLVDPAARIEFLATTGVTNLQALAYGALEEVSQTLITSLSHTHSPL